jgi:hypothetical protein
MVPDPTRPGTGVSIHPWTYVWPRKDERLLSGEPVYSADAVDVMIAEIRGGA